MTHSDRTSKAMVKALLLGGYLWLTSHHIAEAANTTGNELTTCVSGKPVKETIEGCTKVMSLPSIDEPTRRAALLIRGNAYYSINELELASTDYVSAQKISYSTDVSFGLGSIYINSGKSDEAIVEFSKIIDAGDGSANVFNHRGMAFENAGKYEEAISDFNKALFLAPDLLGPVNNRAAAYAKQGNWNDAVKDIDTVLAKNPDMPIALVNRCTFQVRAGNADLGFRSCDRAEHLDPNNAFILENIGFVYYDAGRFMEAIDYFNRGLRLAPGRATALYGRGKAEAKLGKSSDSEADIVAAERIQPNIASFLATSGFK